MFNCPFPCPPHQIKTARALNVSDDGAAYIDFDSFQCTRGQLEAMSSKLAKYRVVAFIVYENIVRDAGHGVKLRVTGDACHDEYLRVSGSGVVVAGVLAMGCMSAHKGTGAGVASGGTREGVWAGGTRANRPLRAVIPPSPAHTFPPV